MGVSTEEPEEDPLSVDDVMEQVSDMLRECEGDFIEHVANQALGRKIKYIGDSLFRWDD